MRTALYLLCSLILLPCTGVSAQSLTLSPEERKQYMEEIPFREKERSLDTLNSIYQSALREKDTLMMIHAGSWVAMVSYEEDLDKALILAEEVTKLARQNKLPEDDYRLSPAYWLLGYVSTDVESSVRYNELASAAAPKGSYLSCEVKLSLARVYRINCDERIEPLFEEIEELIELQAKERREYITEVKLMPIKQTYLSQCVGNLEQSEILRSRSLEFLAQRKDDPEYMGQWAVSLVDLAFINYQMGNLTKTKERMEEIAGFDLKSLPIGIEAYANLNTSIFNVLASLGEFGELREVLTDELNYLKGKGELVNPKILINVYSQLAVATQYLQDFEASKNYLMARRPYLPAFDLDQSESLSIIHYHLQEYKAAIDTALSALQNICEDCNGALPGVDDELAPYPNLNFRVANLYQVIKLAKYAQITAGKVPDVKALRSIVTYNNKAASFYQRDFAEATDEDSRYRNSQYLSEFYSYGALMEAHLVEITGARADHAALFQTLENGKAMDLKREKIFDKIPHDLAEKERILSSQLRTLEVERATTSEANVSGVEERILAVSEEYNGLWKQLKSEYGEQLDYAFDNRNITLRELQESLPDESVFVHYAVSQSGGEFVVVIQVVPESGEPAAFRVPVTFDLLSSAKEMGDLLRSPLQAQTAKRERFIELSNAFYDLLIRPIKDEFSAGTELLISPDKVLFVIPFETLFSSSEDKPYEELPYLVREHDINYHISATSYLESRAVFGNGKDIIAFAPVFEKETSMPSATNVFRLRSDSLLNGLRDGVVDPLPATRQEVNNIAGAYEQSDVEILLDDKANKGALLKALNQPSRIIHIASHGFVNEENNDLSALACYSDGGEAGTFLYANEIRNQNIQTDLVVISSCDSGLGRQVYSSGLLSLNHAFIYGGARNVISTLWKIDDQFSSKLMTKFHEEVASGASYSSALGRAKRGFLRHPKTALPRYWAPFILVGE